MSTVKTQWNMDTVKYGHDRTWALSNVYRIQDEYSEDTVEHEHDRVRTRCDIDTAKSGHTETWTR